MLKKILIADDEPDILKIVTIRLSKMGYELTLAADGAQALDFARQSKPDLIFLDYRMPVLNGLEVCDQLKADAALKQIPVVIMTASAAMVDDQALKKAKADGFIKKPFEAAEIVGLIKKFSGESV